MDEPLGALDRKLRAQLQLEIKRIQKERHVSVIYVTHDQEEALTMSDRIAVMSEGEIAQIGTPEVIYEHPATEFVATFVGETNLFRIVDVNLGGPVAIGRTAEGITIPVPRPAEKLQYPATIVVRPERIQLHGLARQSETASQNHAVVRAQVDEVVYSGEVRRFVVSFGPQQVTIKRQADQFLSDINPGDWVDLSWRPADACWLFK